jgi:hypothetical protein
MYFPLVGGQTIPPHRLCVVLHDSGAVRVAKPEVELSNWGVATSWPRQQLVQSLHILRLWKTKHCTACRAIRYTTLCQALLTAATKALAAAEAHPRPHASIVLGIQADWARVLQQSVYSARGNRPTT